MLVGKFLIMEKLLKLSAFLVMVNSTKTLEIKNNLRVASSLRPHFLLKLTENGRHSRYKGFVKDFFDELLNILDYKYEMLLAEEHRPSVSSRVNVSSGYWDGVIGMLIRNEADLAFGDTEITMERSQVVDFSAPVLSTRYAVLHTFKNDSISKIGTSFEWTIFSPFPLVVWIPFIVVAVLYFGFLQIHHFRERATRFKSIQKLKYSKKFAAVVLVAWMLLLFTSYISNYTAQKVLTATLDKDETFQSLVDIASQKDVKIGWLARGPVETFLRSTANELYQKVYMGNVGRDWVSSVNEGVSKVLRENGKYAFILDSLTADYKTLQDCSLYKLPHEFGPIRSFGVATPIGSPLRERINQAVLSLSEQGIIEALHTRWFASANNLCTSKRPNMNVITTNGSLREMSPVFIFAVIGLFLATVIGLLEIQLLKKRNSTPQAKPPRQQTELLPKFNLEVV